MADVFFTTNMANLLQIRHTEFFQGKTVAGKMKSQFFQKQNPDFSNGIFPTVRNSLRIDGKKQLQGPPGGVET